MSRTDVQDIVEGRIDEGFQRVTDMLAAALEGTGNLDDWHTAMEEELKQAHLQISALGRGGWNQMTQADYGRVGGKLAAEYRFLNEFAEQINDGNLTIAEISNRMEMYESGVWSQFWESQNEVAGRAGATHEERVLDPAAEHCRDCIDFADEGIVPLGSLPPPGEQSECGPRCRCAKIYYKQVRGRFVRVA